MSVHYKFKSACEFSTLPVDGVNISVEDLKEAIIEQKRLSRSQPFDLIITNAETNKEYTDEKTLIPKNSSLLVARVPIDAAKMKRPWNNQLKESTEVLLSNPANLMNTEESSAEAIRLGRLAMQVTDLTTMAGSEQDRINAMMAQSTLDYHPSRYVKLRNSRMSGKVPVGYTCFKCSKGGHWVANCPLSNQDLRKSYGIPSDQLIRVTDPNTPGVMVTARGNLVIYKKNPEAIEPTEPSEEPERLPLPAELQCGLCNELLRDPVLIPCCAEKFCDDCIREHLVESDDGQCPQCLENDVNVGNLIPNRYLRKKVAEFDKLTNGNHIKNYEKQYLSPPASVAPLPPHLRSSKHNTPRSSPPAEVTVKTQETGVSSDQTNKDKVVPSPHDGSNSQIDASPKLRTVSPVIPPVPSLSSSPSLLSNVAAAAAAAPARVPEPSPPVELYRGLLKDVEENEKALASKKNSPNIASQSDVESEKSKKSKKKKEKKKKNGKDKEKKKDKHKRSSKSHKNRVDDSVQGSDVLGTLTEMNRDVMSPGRGRKRSRSSESASSNSPRPDKKLNDSTTELFNVALNIPYGQNSAAPYRYTGSDAMYPPPGIPNFSVPPPGYHAPPQPHSQSWLPFGPDAIIDDPLAAFNRHLKEQDERKRLEQMRRQRSPSYGRSYQPRNWSRSRSRSPDRGPRSISRSPRPRRHRWSRSRSPYSPRRHHSPPSHRRMNSPPSMHRRYSPVDRRHSPPSSHHKFANTPEQRLRGDRLRTSSRSRSPSVRAKYGPFSPARPHLMPPHQRALQQPGRVSPSHGCSASPANRAFIDDGGPESYLHRGGRERPELHPERREARTSVKDRLGFDADDPRRADRPGEIVRGPPMMGDFHGRPDLERPPFGDPQARPLHHLSPHSSSPVKKLPRSRSPSDRSIPRHYDNKPRRPGMSPSPPMNKSPYNRVYRDSSRSRSRGRSHRGRYRDDSASRSRRYSPNREESRAFLERVGGSPKDSRSSRNKNRSSPDLREAQLRRSSNTRRRGFSSEKSRSRSRDRRVRDSRRSDSRGRRRDPRDDSSRKQDYKSKNSSVSDKGEGEKKAVAREEHRTPEIDHRHDASQKDVLPKASDRSKLDETEKHDDRKKYDRYKSGDKYRIDDRNRSDDRIKTDDRTRSDDRNRTEDGNRTDDHNKSDDHRKGEEPKKATDEQEKSDELYKTDVTKDDVSKDEEKHKLEKEKKKRDKKKKKKEKKERRLSHQSECSQNETTDDEPKKRKKKQDKKHKESGHNPVTSEMKEVQITLGNVSVSSATPEQNQGVSSGPVPPFSPSLLPELSKWERDEEASDANHSTDALMKEEERHSEPVVTSDVLRKAESALLHGRGVFGRVLLPRKGFAESERAKQLEELRAKSEMSEFPFDVIDREAKTKGPSIQITISSKNESDIWMKKPSNFPVAPESGVTQPQPPVENSSASEGKHEEKTSAVGSEKFSTTSVIEPSDKEELSPVDTSPEFNSKSSGESVPKEGENVETTNEKVSNVGEESKSQLPRDAILESVNNTTTDKTSQSEERFVSKESKNFSLQQKSVELLQSSQHLLQLGDSVLKKLPPLESNTSCNETPIIKLSSEGVCYGKETTSIADPSFLPSDTSRLGSREPASSTAKESLDPTASSEGGEQRKDDGMSSSHASDLTRAFHRLPNFRDDRPCRESTASTEATTEEEEVDKKKKQRKKRKRSVSSSSDSESDSSSDSNSDSEEESQRKKRKKNKKKKKNEGRNVEDGEGKSKKKKKKDKKRKKSKKQKKLKS